jgi:hypothetical protein
MKTILFVMAMALACSSVPSHANPLMKDYIGAWCYDGDYNDIRGAYDSTSCESNEKSIEIDQKGYNLSPDDRCDFVSIKIIPNSGMPRFAIPNHIRTVARCAGEGVTWTEQREFSVGRTPSINIKRLK